MELYDLTQSVNLFLRQPLVDDLDRYLTSTAEERDKALGSWQKLRAYQMLVPADLDGLSVDLFISNMKVVLAVLCLRGQSGNGAAGGSRV